MLGQLAPRPRIGVAVTTGIAGVAGIGLALPSEPIRRFAIAKPFSLDDCVAGYAA
jgi:hypothetical protein